jgi:hypothetical protein
MEGKWGKPVMHKDEFTVPSTSTSTTYKLADTSIMKGAAGRPEAADIMTHSGSIAHA